MARKRPRHCRRHGSCPQHLKLATPGRAGPAVRGEVCESLRKVRSRGKETFVQASFLAHRSQPSRWLDT